MSNTTIGEKPKFGREMWGGLDEDSIELEAAELGLVEGSDYFSVQQCYEEIVKQEIGARHPSMHETIEGMEYHLDRILTANPVPSEKMSRFEQIIDPTPGKRKDASRLCVCRPPSPFPRVLRSRANILAERKSDPSPNRHREPDRRIK